VKKHCFLILQATVLTHTRWSETFSYDEMHYSFLVNLMQKLSKSVNICKSCSNKLTATFFMPHSVETLLWLHPSSTLIDWLIGDAFIMLYKSLARSHLCANSVWNPYILGLIICLKEVQMRATKLAIRIKNLVIASWSIQLFINKVGAELGLFHDVVLSPISQHSVWSEITSHNPLHWSVTSWLH